MVIKMKIFVTGVNGQLGHDVMNELSSRGYTGIGSDIQEQYVGVQDQTPACDMPYISMDITNQESVYETLKEVKPDVVVHCAAWTAVDLAEDEDKQDVVYKVNVDGTRNIAFICKELDCKMIYLSTDYVFDGQGEQPWEPDDKNYSPINFYGKTKLLGEQEVSGTLSKYFIVRISWVFGNNGKNFIKTMLQVGKKHPKISVVNDQIGAPTYTLDLARLLVDMAGSEKYGYYHATNGGADISWYDFTKEIFRQAVELGYEAYQEEMVEVKSVTTKEYGISKAARPFNSRLDKSKLEKNGFAPLPEWKDALGRYLKAILPTME